MPTEDRGPSYWDVSEAVAHLGARYNVQISWRTLPPVRVDSSGKWTSWGCVCEVRDASGKPYAGPAYTAYWGAGGAWKTAPAAYYASLLKLQAWLEEREAAATAVAAF